MTQSATKNAPAKTNANALAPIMEAVLSNEIDTEKMSKMLDIQERWEQNEARKAFQKAISEFQKENIDVSKGEKANFQTKGGGNASYSFASLGASLQEIRPALAKYGLSITWRTQNMENGFIQVTAILSHEFGHFEHTSLAGQPDQTGAKNPIQSVGSTITYLKRYTAFSILGIASVDDDGAESGMPIAETKPKPSPSYYTKSKFDRNKGKWKGLINNGSQTPYSLITMIESKSNQVLTTEQKDEIMGWAND